MRSSLYSDMVTSLSSQIDNNVLPTIIPEKAEETKLNSTVKYNLVTRFKKF